MTHNQETIFDAFCSVENRTLDVISFSNSDVIMIHKELYKILCDQFKKQLILCEDVVE